MPERPWPSRGLASIGSESVLKWGGVGLVVLAIGFAVSTAISRGWIGPELQLAGAVAVSGGMIHVGLRLRPVRLPWTHALCAGGVLGLFTTFASSLFLDQAADDVAFIATIAVGLVAFVLARFVPSEWVGGAALIGGASGWLTIGRGHPPFDATLLWLAVAAALAVVLSLEQGWFALRLGGHVVALCAVIAHAEQAESTVDASLVLVIGAAVVASLLWVPSVGDLQSRWQQLEVQLPMVVGPWAFGTLVFLLDTDGKGTLAVVALAVAVGLAIAASGLYRSIKSAHLAAVLIGSSVALTISIGLFFSVSYAVTAIAVQGAGLLELSRHLESNWFTTAKGAALVGVAALVDFGAMVDAWSENASFGADVSHVATIAAIGFAAWRCREDSIRLLGAVGVLGLALLWVGSVLVHLPQGQAAVSVAWAVIGTVVLVAGASNKMPRVAAAGLAVIGLTVIKLLTVDLQEVDTLWRAGLFLLVGFGLLRLGFLLPRLSSGPEAQADAGQTAPPPIHEAT